ncbi:hypothetical protein Q3A66_16860 [Hymenobacter sp. BT770]|uniref:hypothetical protein n=1 Tax=Hymenobacter sp. BT770 TaxID=2886942 RepID=UPI001D120CBD|nr:hypothetical protein [Hymenobacter sp. BT770]MCC3154688.1 hypothetical protein [Hymenobacter sp. BT770]MDO3416742.1 hypothetical protein [Hymenobacter sp. BT770]
MEISQDLIQAEQAEQQQALDQLFQYAAQQMHAGKSDAQIHALLLGNGATDEVAQAVVSELRPEYQKLYREAARKDMLHGGLWLGGGLLVTGFTYAMASADGGSYFMTWGAIIFGGIQFLKGLVRSMKE